MGNTLVESGPDLVSGVTVLVAQENILIILSTLHSFLKEYSGHDLYFQVYS